MVNQWGRGGNPASASQAIGLTIPVIIALVMGIAGGYGASRYLNGDSSNEISARDNRIAALEETVSALRLNNEKVPSPSPELEKLQRQAKDAAREIDALNTTLEEAGDLRASLDKATRSLSLSQTQLSGLKRVVQERDLAIAKLENELGQQANNADAASSGRIKSLMRENSLMSSRLAAGDKKRAMLTGKIEALEATNTTLNSTIRKLEDSSKAVETQNSTLKNQIEELQRAAKLLEAKVDTIASEPTAQPQKPSANLPLSPTRSSAAVERALANMPGLERLSNDRQDTLRVKLIDGACVTDALASVFDRVPVLALRSLIRDLKSPC